MAQPTPLMPHATATWLVDNTGLSFEQIADFCGIHILGTTRTTIAAIRDRSHWNIANIQPKDPVTLGLCSQRELDAVVAKAAKKAGTAESEAPIVSSGTDRDRLIAELRAERDANEKAASEAAQQAEADAWLEAKRAGEAAENEA